MIRFVLNGAVLELAVEDPTLTVLDLLRYRLGLTGTKEGCAEGDCGACTVLLGELTAAGQVEWGAVNSCILFVPMLDGRAVLTVESLAAGGALHPVQQAMVDRHGSQCGFCTPGFVMSLYGRTIGAGGTSGEALEDVIAGNLCRCTGYGPILEAGRSLAPVPRDDGETAALLRTIDRVEPLALATSDPLHAAARHWFAPRTLDELAALREAHPQARLLAGATDVGLWVTKQHRRLDAIIWLGEIAPLRRCEESAAGLTLGATVTFTRARAALARLHPALGELVRRVGGVQIRNSGTIGGNIANGSPIGDLAPALIALGATLTLRRGAAWRTIALEDYFVAYGEQDLAPGEFIASIFVPRPPPGTRIAITKLSKRFASDITAVLGAFAIRIEDDRVAHARVAFGGMAGTPRRALGAEAALLGEPWSEQTVARAIAALAQDFTPLSDVRGSAAYRLAVAGNLLRRLWLADEHPGEPLALIDLARADG